MLVPPFLLQSIKVIDNWLSYRRFFNRIPGLAMGIVYKNTVIFAKGYGYSDLETKSLVTPESCFRIASISKTFTATAILQLSEEGKLNLNDRVAKHLPWLDVSKSEQKEITIRQLLTHLSGVSRDGNTSHWYNDVFPNLENIKSQAQSGFLTFTPGERFKYSNLGYTLLGGVIEVVSGQTYEDYVNRNIIQRLNLKNTYPEYRETLKSLLVTGYGRDIPGQERGAFVFPKTNIMAPAAGLISNVTDLCLFLSAHFPGNNLLLSDESKREMQKVQRYQKSEKRQYGLGLEIWKSNNQTLIGHGGAFQGYRCKIGMDLKNRIGVVLLSNAIDAPIPTLVNGVFHTVKYFKNNRKEYKPNASKDFGKYTGLFTGRWGDIVVVDINGHALGFDPSEDKPLEKPYKLEFIKGGHFKIVSCDTYSYLGEEVLFTLNDENRLEAHFGPGRLVRTNPNTYQNVFH